MVCPRDLVTYVKKIRYRTAFVAALFDSIVGPVSTWGGVEVVGITSEDLVTYVKKIRYRLTEPIPDDVAAQMFAEADGLLDMDELTNTDTSCGVESVYLPRWCALFNTRYRGGAMALEVVPAAAGGGYTLFSYSAQQ
eukprot:COSAG05_NODE_78_length_21399_cov_26.298216_17_plen_137_part_00